MDYLLTFIEGIITFISPCILPMLPIYISYFAGINNEDENKNKYSTLTNALGFVLGLTIVFVLLGAAAGTFGQYIKQHQTIFNVIGGLFLILFGLNYMEIIKLSFLNKTLKIKTKLRSINFLSSLMLGLVFSIGWTPCVGVFLGSALLLAANSHDHIRGIVLLLLYSLGLGIPFVLSALLIDNLKKTFHFIKHHYKIINIISGLFLIIVGIFMMFGMLNRLLSILTF